VGKETCNPLREGLGMQTTGASRILASHTAAPVPRLRHGHFRPYSKSGQARRRRGLRTLGRLHRAVGRLQPGQGIQTPTPEGRVGLARDLVVVLPLPAGKPGLLRHPCN